LNFNLLFTYKLIFSKGSSFSKFIIKLSVIATAVSVVAMIVTLSFVNGFQEEVGNKVFNFWGHIHLQHLQNNKALISEETPIYENDTIVKLLSNQKQINYISTYSTKSAVIEKNKTIEGILIKGISISKMNKFFATSIIKGAFLKPTAQGFSKEIILSARIANELQIKVGDTVKLHFISLKGDNSNNTRKLKVVGIYKTGIEEYDKLFVFTDIKLLQQINNWQNNQIGGYELYLHDYHTMELVSNQLSTILPPEWISRTTKEIFPNIFDWLNIQDVNRNVVFIIMTIVAIINLITCLLVLVLERTKMIGILKAIGATNGQIQQIFLFQASLITIIGITLGAFIGIGFCLIQNATHFIKLDEASYYVSYAPVKIIGWQVMSICMATSFVCFIALILPTLVIKRISPVKAIQFS